MVQLSKYQKYMKIYTIVKFNELNDKKTFQLLILLIFLKTN